MLLRTLADKRGLSDVVSYILLISISVVMGGIVAAYLLIYVPKPQAECAQGTSLLIEKTLYNCASKMLNVTIKNNGMFSVNGYFIWASTSSDANVAPTKDLSACIKKGGVRNLNSVAFPGTDINAFDPGAEITSEFDMSLPSCNTIPLGATIYRIQVTPNRAETVNSKQSIVICKDKLPPEPLVCS